MKCMSVNSKVLAYEIIHGTRIPSQFGSTYVSWRRVCSFSSDNVCSVLWFSSLDIYGGCVPRSRYAQFILPMYVGVTIFESYFYKIVDSNNLIFTSLDPLVSFWMALTTLHDPFFAIFLQRRCLLDKFPVPSTFSGLALFLCSRFLVIEDCHNFRYWNWFV